MSRYNNSSSRSKTARDGMRKRKETGKEANLVDASTNGTRGDIGLSTKDRGNGNTLNVSNG